MADVLFVVWMPTSHKVEVLSSAAGSAYMAGL